MDNNNYFYYNHSTQLPTNGIVVQVDHLMFNRTLYFQLARKSRFYLIIYYYRLFILHNPLYKDRIKRKKDDI